VSSRRILDRRRFLGLALVAGGLAVVLALLVTGLPDRLRAWFFPRRLPGPVLSFLRSLDPVDEAAAGAIALGGGARRALRARTETLLSEAAAIGQPLESALLDRIEADFAAGRLVDADDWYLAETEAAVLLIQADLARGGYRAS
jgi:hypothetical protein